ncbi:hypothetical protein RB196_30935 [Streptomyces sp. PmtA]|uniref:hypothetical protein n=1 Tax=Streptomyces sp. PmtA TaxID=3074275 RepID=UPI00301425FE
MNGVEGGARDSADLAAGFARLEGYLMANAHVLAARTAAEGLADRMPWLTAGERTELVRLSTADRIQASREHFEAVAVRARELEEQYGARYRELSAPRPDPGRRLPRGLPRPLHDHLRPRRPAVTEARHDRPCRDGDRTPSAGPADPG